MAFTDTETRLIGVVRASCGATVTTTAATLHEDLGLDSLGVIELIMAIENHFEIEISDAEADPLTFRDQGTLPTVAALVAIVDRKLAAKAPA